MSDPTPKASADEVREALAAATPGPWYLDQAGDVRGHSTIEAERMVARPLMSAYRKDPNAYLIANAPTWLAQLLAALEASEWENERLREALERIMALDPYEDWDDDTGARDDDAATITAKSIARHALATPPQPGNAE